MPNYAEILGDKVRFYERTLVEEKDLEAVLALYEKKGKSKFISNRIPNHTKFMAHSEEVTMYVVEMEPRYVTVRYGWGLAQDINLPLPMDDNAKIARVPAPWEYYLMAFSDQQRTDAWGGTHYVNSALSLLWSPTRINEISDPVWPANLPNIGSGGVVCLGGTTVEGEAPYLTLQELVNDFYNTDFNSDMGGATGPFNTIDEWLAADPNPANWDWPPHGSSLAEAMNTVDFPILADPENAIVDESPVEFLKAILRQLPEPSARRLANMIVDAQSVRPAEASEINERTLDIAEQDRG